MPLATGFNADPAGSRPLDANWAATLLQRRTENVHDGIDKKALRQSAALATNVRDDGGPAFCDTFRKFVDFVAERPF